MSDELYTEDSAKHRQTIWGRFEKNRLAIICLVFTTVLLIIAICAPIIANERPVIMRYNGNWYAPAIYLSKDLAGLDFDMVLDGPPEGTIIVRAPIGFSPANCDLDFILSPPSARHILGTDGEGRDVAAQIVWGSRVSLSVGLIAVGISAIIGIAFGALAGYYGGWIDICVSRLIEVMMCFPTFFLILTMLAFVGPSIYNIMIVIGLTGWTGIARLMRAECLRLRNREFVISAHAIGSSDRRTIVAHILPNAIAPILVVASFGIAGAILAEGSLSFLGFGVGVSESSWGSLLAQGKQFMDVAWWLTLIPGSAIFLTVAAYNIIGEAFRDAVDVKS